MGARPAEGDLQRFVEAFEGCVGGTGEGAEDLGICDLAGVEMDFEKVVGAFAYVFVGFPIVFLTLFACDKLFQSRVQATGAGRSYHSSYDPCNARIAVALPLAQPLSDRPHKHESSLQTSQMHSPNTKMTKGEYKILLISAQGMISERALGTTLENGWEKDEGQGTKFIVLIVPLTLLTAIPAQ